MMYLAWKNYSQEMNRVWSSIKKRKGGATNVEAVEPQEGGSDFVNIKIFRVTRTILDGDESAGIFS